jgi:hypothetical protein
MVVAASESVENGASRALITFEMHVQRDTLQAAAASVLLWMTWKTSSESTQLMTARRNFAFRNISAQAPIDCIMSSGHSCVQAATFRGYRRRCCLLIGGSIMRCCILVVFKQQHRARSSWMAGTDLTDALRLAQCAVPKWDN